MLQVRHMNELPTHTSEADFPEYAYTATEPKGTIMDTDGHQKA